MIEVEQVTKSFGPTRALDGVTFSVAQGEIVGLLGPNGAGKTTLVRMLATLLRPDSGRLRVGGFDSTREPKRVRELIGLAGQSAAVDELLTGRENLELVARLYGVALRQRRQRTDEILARFDLVDAADRRASIYSSGMRRRLDLAVTLVGGPEVMLLDEPTAGLDPRSRTQLWELVERVAGEGTTVLLTSQYLDEVERLAERIVVIDRGVMIADGSADELKRAVSDDLGMRRPSMDDVFFALTARDDAAPVVVRSPVMAQAPLAAATHPRPPNASSPSRWRSLSDMSAVTRRYLLRFVRIPQLLFLGTAQPVVFVVMLNAVFGGLVARVGGGAYIQYLLPGILVMNVMLGASVTSAGLAEDMQAGVIDRFRSLPMSRAAVLVGRTVADLVRNAVGVVVTVLVGLVMGYEVSDAGPALGGVALVLFFAFAVSWLFALVGLTVREPEVAQLAGFLPVLPLVFLSGAWIPIETMSGRLQSFARNQPVNVLVEALRALGNGGDASPWVWRSIAWTAAMLLIAIPLSIRQYRVAGA